MSEEKQRRIIIAGTRTFQDYNLLRRTLEKDHAVAEGTVIVSGTAPGADQLGERFAREHGLEIGGRRHSAFRQRQEYLLRVVFPLLSTR